MSPRTSDSLPEAENQGSFWTQAGAVVTQLRRAYGDLFRLRMPRGTLICAVGLDANRAFLTENDEKLAYGSGWDHVAPAIAEMGRGVVFMDGPDHRWFRRVLMPAFSPAVVAAHVPLMHEIARARLSRWPKNGPINLYVEVNAITFDITAALVIGLRDEEKLRSLNLIFRQLTLRESVSGGRGEMQRRLAGAMLPLIRERMQAPANDAVSRMIRAAAAEGRWLSEDELLAQSNTLMVAGHFTSAGLCSYFLLHAAGHPYTPRLREELLAHDAPDMDTLQGMTLLHHALLEAERFVSPVPHLPRGFASDMAFKDCVFKPGEIVVCSVVGTHMDETIYPAPEKYDPERFAPERRGERRDPLALTPFGAGFRRCIGALMAETMIKIIVHHVLRDFAIRPLKDAYATPVSMPILRPLNGMPVVVRALRR
jgi:cytochrome P450